jgi:hypothetical protein
VRTRIDVIRPPRATDRLEGHICGRDECVTQDKCLKYLPHIQTDLDVAATENRSVGGSIPPLGTIHSQTEPALPRNRAPLRAAFACRSGTRAPALRHFARARRRLLPIRRSRLDLECDMAFGPLSYVF